MKFTNHSQQNPTSFLLMGIPGLEASHFWIAFPFCSMYTLAVLSNMAVLLVVYSEPELHQPMYLFLCMLSIIDLVLCTSTVPKLLALFWANTAEITFGGCATQMFFIHGFSAVESGLLLAMAFDRYLAICRPLHYGLLLPPEAVGKLGAAAVFRGLGLMTPLTCLLARLSYCGRVVAHSYCEHMAVVKLACGGTQPNNIYGITAATLVVGTDSICIAISYALILRAVLGLSSKEARLRPSALVAPIWASSFCSIHRDSSRSTLSALVSMCPGTSTFSWLTSTLSCRPCSIPSSTA